MNDIKALRRGYRIAAGGIIVVCAFTLWFALGNLMWMLYFAGAISAETLDTVNDLLPTGGVSTLLVLVAGVAFLSWSGRARRNLSAWPDAQPQYGPGWTIGAWFIPLANLILPPLVLADIAKHSTADPQRRSKLLRSVWLWWAGYAAYILATVALAVILIQRIPYPYDETPYLIVQSVGGLIWIATGGLAIRMMHAITEAQADRSAGTPNAPNPADFPTFTVDQVQVPRQPAESAEPPRPRP